MESERPGRRERRGGRLKAQPILELPWASSHASGNETPLRRLDLSVAAMILGTRFRDPVAVLTRLLDEARPHHEG